jgi:hypothetical protein
VSSQNSLGELSTLPSSSSHSGFSHHAVRPIQGGAVEMDAVALQDLAVQRQLYFDTATWASNPSVGRPPGMALSGAGACTTASAQLRQP